MKPGIEAVNHPKHYKSCTEKTRSALAIIISPKEFDRECIEVIEEYNLNFHVGNAVKYLWRAGQKGDLLEDLKKALWYMDRWVDKGDACTLSFYELRDAIGAMVEDERN